MPGMEYLPAALARRRFLRAARRVGAPVGGDEIDVDAEPLEEVGGHVAHSLGDRDVLRDHAGDRLAGVAAFLEQALRRIEIARPVEDFAAFLAVEGRTRGQKARQWLPQRFVVADT